LSKRVVTTMLVLLGAAMAANCGDDSGGSSGGDAGMGGGGTIDDAGEGPGSGATTSGGGMPGSGDAGSSADAGAGTTPGGAPGSSGAAQGGAGGSDGSSVCPASVADFPSVFAEAVCRKRVECCDNNTTQTCMAEVGAALDEIFPDLAQAVQDGSVQASCSALDVCIAAIDAADCADFPKELGMLYGVPVDEPACRSFLKGTVAPTDECSSTYQCNNGFCSDGDGAGGAGTTCVALVADGQPCDNDSICNLSTSYCATGMCTPRLANGETCTAAAQCQSRVCDTADTDTCVAPSAAQCEYVPEGCSFSGRPVRDSLGWSALIVALVLGAGTRRRRHRGLSR
jgi:hypothetical protein